MSIETLLQTNVNDHTEKKANLTYLSWAWAWAEALKADPKATYKVEMFDGKCYMDINGTFMVWVTATIFDKPMTCQLPVMDHRNKAIPNPDAFQVNTAIMRCMTKALSLHGLGLYIYAGEDLPEGDEGGISKARSKVIAKVVNAIVDRFNGEDIVGAYGEYIEIIDGDEKIELWGKLPSNIRSALKKHGESLKQPKAE